jgi:hypothetical protein
LPKNDEVPDEVPPEILNCSREPEMEREHTIEETCRTRTVTLPQPLHQIKESESPATITFGK